MEGQSRPSVMGFSSMYFKSSKRFDRASLVEGFKNIKDRGVRYEDLFPGSYDPAERVKEMIEGQTDAEVIFNGVGHGVERHQAHEGQGARAGVLQGLQRLDGRVPEPRPRAIRVQRARCPPRASTTRWTSCSGCAGMGLRTVQLEATRAVVQRAHARSTTASGPRRSSSTCRSTSTPSSSSPTATSAPTSPPRVCRRVVTRGRRSWASNIEAGDFPVILSTSSAAACSSASPTSSWSAPRCTPGGSPTTSSGSTTR